MLERTLIARKNISLLTSRKFLYIEDSKGVGYYSTLLKNNLKEESSKIKVISLDSKLNVIDKFIELQNKSNIKNYAFLVDLDFDLLLNKEKIEHNSFFYLDKYTFENYLIDEDTAVNIISSYENLEQDFSIDKFNYSEWTEKIIKAYKKILPLFLAIRTLDSHPVETSKCDCNALFDMTNFELDSNKVSNYLKRIPKTLKCGNHICIQINYFMKLLSSEDIFNNIPGKQMLKLFIARINQNLKQHINEQTYKTIALMNPENKINYKIKEVTQYLLS